MVLYWNFLYGPPSIGGGSLKVSNAYTVIAAFTCLESDWVWASVWSAVTRV